MLETDDSATILFTWHGYAHTASDGVRQPGGAMTHITDHGRYQWPNDVICAPAGVTEPRADGHSSEVTIEVTQLVWEPAAAQA